MREEQRDPRGPDLLEVLDLDEAVVAMDSLHTQRATVALVSGAGADHVLSVKANQKSSYTRLNEPPWARIPVLTRKDHGHRGRTTWQSRKVTRQGRWVNGCRSWSTQAVHPVSKLPSAACRAVSVQRTAKSPCSRPDTSPRGRTLVDRELYLPKSWTSDRERCRAAKVPDEQGFATQNELARSLITRALASPLPFAWVTADALYGQDWQFRRTIEEAGLGYVVAVPKSQQVKSLAGTWRIDQITADAPDDACAHRTQGHRDQKTLWTSSLGDRTHHLATDWLPQTQPPIRTRSPQLPGISGTRSLTPLL